jgi:hypothetical protein
MVLAKSKRADLSTALLGFCSVWDFLRAAPLIYSPAENARACLLFARVQHHH